MPAQPSTATLEAELVRRQAAELAALLPPAPGTAAPLPPAQLARSRQVRVGTFPMFYLELPIYCS